MNRRLLFALIVALGCGSMASAQTTIADHMQRATSGRVVVHQPAALNARLNPANGDSTNVAIRNQHKAEKNVVGYRVQVFSDRNQRTAKSEALSKERDIKEAFPDMATYVTYDAPSWRLKVGDFRTRDEASVRLAELKEMFPGYANEMSIVIDVINTEAQ